MVQCPKCSTPVTVDFGITSCTGCDSVLFIDVSGNVQIEGVATAVISDIPLPTINTTPVDGGDGGFPRMDTAPVESVGFNQPQEAELAVIPDSPPTVFSEPQPAAFAKNDLNEISSYGNTEISLGKEGPYLYDLMIWNIDSREIREQLRLAMSDRRFGWDTESLFAQIHQGALRISQLNSVKAAVLVSRIKNLPVGISWEQKQITDSNV